MPTYSSVLYEIGDRDGTGRRQREPQRQANFAWESGMVAGLEAVRQSSRSTPSRERRRSREAGPSLKPGPALNVARILLSKRRGGFRFRAREVALRLSTSAVGFVRGIEVWLRLGDCRRKRLTFIEDSMLQDHERDFRVACGVSHGCELLRTPEPFRSDVHVCTLIQQGLHTLLHLR